MIKSTEGGKDDHMLVIMDHLMHYMQALVTLQTAKCTAKALSDRFIVHYDIPESIVSDQGQNFKVTSLQSCVSWKIWKLQTSPHHFQTNGQCECFNHALINMLGALPPKKSSWRDMVTMLVHAYNCTRSTATGFSPYYLVCSWKPLLPIELYFGNKSADMNATKSIAAIAWKIKAGI